MPIQLCVGASRDGERALSRGIKDNFPGEVLRPLAVRLYDLVIATGIPFGRQRMGDGEEEFTVVREAAVDCEFPFMTAAVMEARMLILIPSVCLTGYSSRGRCTTHWHCGTAALCGAR